MKKIYTIKEDGCVTKILFSVVVDDDEIVEDSIRLAMGTKNKVEIGDFVLDFGSKNVSIEVKDDVIDDFSESYVISIGADLMEAIRDDLMNRGVDPDIAYDVASNIEYSDIEVNVDVSVRDSDVNINSIQNY